jgi:hypothetical protein
MYMDGFRFSLQGNQPCLNLFFPEWTLDSKAKFYGALVGIFLLALVVEAISTFRYRIVQVAKKAHRRSEGTAGTSSRTSVVCLRLSVTVLHGVQGLLGYMLMLATMTFSVELLAAVVLGLALGYGFFFQRAEALGRLHVTSNPCCSFLEGEARETMRASEVTQAEEEEAPEIEEERNNEEEAETSVMTGVEIIPGEEP